MEALSWKARIYILVLVILAMPLIVYSSANLVDSDLWSGILIFTVIIIINTIALLCAIRLPDEVNITLSFPLVYATMLLFGKEIAILAVFFARVLSEIWLLSKYRYEGNIHWKEKLRSLPFNTAQGVLAIGMTGLVFEWYSGQAIFDSFSSRTIIAIILSVVTFLVIDLFATNIMTSLAQKKKKRRKYTFADYWQYTLQPNLLEYLGTTSLALIIVILYQQSPFYLIILIPTIVLIYFALANYSRQFFETKQIISNIAETIAGRDYPTGGHIRRVAEMAKEIAIWMGLPLVEVVKTELSAIIHDIGKIAIPDAVLLKPGKLTDEEFKVMQRHVTHKLIEGLPYPFRGLDELVRHHHERWDGTGYPDGLKGEENPISARILAVADVWDALRAKDRPYKPPMPLEKALEIIKKGSGSQFDPQVVEIFLEIIEEERKIEEEKKQN